MKTSRERKALINKLKSSEEIEQQRNLHLAKIISISISILGLIVMGPLNLAQGNLSMSICSFGYGLLALIVVFYTFLKKDLLGFNIITTIITYYLIINYLITGGNEGFGITWILLFPLLYLYMLKNKMYMIIIITNVVIIAIAFFTPVNQFIYQGWNTSYRIRFTLLLFIESLFACSYKMASSNTDKNRREILKNLLELQKNLENLVKIRTRELLREKNRSDRLMIELATSLAATIDAKDKYTSGHSKRVADYSKEIAKRLGKTDIEQQEIYFVSLLHDIGKIGIPDEIINKKSKLTEEEYEVIKQHPGIGSDILKTIETLPEIMTAVRWHHERYDGNGYPDKLKGEAIPEYAQIVAVADAYDAMTSNRSYRNLLSQEIVRKEIEKGIGTQFSPKMASIMLNIIDADENYILHE